MGRLNRGYCQAGRAADGESRSALAVLVGRFAPKYQRTAGGQAGHSAAAPRKASGRVPRGTVVDRPLDGVGCGRPIDLQLGGDCRRRREILPSGVSAPDHERAIGLHCRKRGLAGIDRRHAGGELSRHSRAVASLGGIAPGHERAVLFAGRERAGRGCDRNDAGSQPGRLGVCFPSKVSKSPNDDRAILLHGGKCALGGVDRGDSSSEFIGDPSAAAAVVRVAPGDDGAVRLQAGKSAILSGEHADNPCFQLVGNGGAVAAIRRTAPRRH